MGYDRVSGPLGQGISPPPFMAPFLWVNPVVRTSTGMNAVGVPCTKGHHPNRVSPYEESPGLCFSRVRPFDEFSFSRDSNPNRVLPFDGTPVPRNVTLTGYYCLIELKPLQGTTMWGVLRNEDFHPDRVRDLERCMAGLIVHKNYQTRWLFATSLSEFNYLLFWGMSHLYFESLSYKCCFDVTAIWKMLLFLWLQVIGREALWGFLFNFLISGKEVIGWASWIEYWQELRLTAKTFSQWNCDLGIFYHCGMMHVGCLQWKNKRLLPVFDQSVCHLVAFAKNIFNLATVPVRFALNDCFWNVLSLISVTFIPFVQALPWFFFS